MNKKRREELNKAIGSIEEAISIIESVRDEEQESFDALPEGLQSGDKGQAMESAISEMENALSTLADSVSAIESAKE